MIYDAQITLTIPEALREIANKIGKAFDPDTGGDKTFNVEPVDGLLVVTFPCVVEFADALPFFLQEPAALYDSVVRDYEQRWSDTEPPTLLECMDFCAGVIIK